MTIESRISKLVCEAVQSLYQAEIAPESVQLQMTRKDLTGDFTVVVFPLTKVSKKGPEQTGEEIGTYLKNNLSEVASFNIIKGFLNLILSDAFWLNQLNQIIATPQYGCQHAIDKSPLMMIEYSSPNTNKPLHLGHIRNNLLGFSLSRIAAANGFNVVKTNIVNDRGIHICKSMLAWKKWGEGQTPHSTGKKGDHLVGEFYVKFDQEYKKELADLQSKGLTKEQAEAQSVMMQDARDMLLKWEANDTEVVDIWKMMNQWVYAGFDETYKALGVDFDKIYYESETYTTGRDMVLEGVDKGVFYKKEDGSVRVDLTPDGLDEKVLLRSDGTSVYMTQDIGTAKLRFDDYKIDKMVYVVGNEQNYHFQVLALVLDKLGFSWGKELVHFSYGMVELPEGKMKSREGTVVDADDLVAEMVNTAREMSKELGKLDGYSEAEAEEIYRMIALGALKYFMLKVDPKKTMTFNPRESIDFNGNTGPFIQYTYARIQSIKRKAVDKGLTLPTQSPVTGELTSKENNLLRQLKNYPNVVAEAGSAYSPAIIANYVYDLAKEYNQFYHDSPMVHEEDADKRNFRMVLSEAVGNVIKTSMYLLGIDVPPRM